MNEELDLIIATTKEQMQASVAHLEKELLNIRAGKANPVMLSTVTVDYYGTKHRFRRWLTSIHPMPEP